jgi:flagellar biosynthesis protein FlhF
MFVKRYLVSDMHEAMTKIKHELGDDAVILNSRMVRQKGVKGLFIKKKLEVVAAYESKSPNAKPAQKKIAEFKKAPPVTPAPANGNIDKLNAKLQELENTVKMFSSKLANGEGSAKLSFTDDISQLHDRLLEQEVVPEIADDIAKEVQKITANMEVEPGQVMEQIIAERMGKPSPISIKKYKRNIIVFFGPTGVGKTTTLVKLAGQYVCEGGLKVGIINTDTYRVAAKEQLNIYADILQIPLETAYTTEELEEALKNQADCDIILMDTAGRSTGDEQYKNEIENLLKTCEPDEVYAVMSLSTGYNSCKKIVDNLSFVGDYKMILTKYDEVNTWGNILNIVDYAKKPLSYITTGQNIPDDIEQADISKIALNILGQGETYD